MEILLIALLVISLWNWISYKWLSEGLIYFAITEHQWEITEKEIKKILEYSMVRNIKDFLNVKD